MRDAMRGMALACAAAALFGMPGGYEGLYSYRTPQPSRKLPTGPTTKRAKVKAARKQATRNRSRK